MNRLLGALLALPRWQWMAGVGVLVVTTLAAAIAAHVEGERRDAREALRIETARETAETARGIRDDQIQNDADAAARDVDGWLRDPVVPFLLAPGSLRDRQAGADGDAP